jgi:protein arginine kinase activator
VFADGSPEWELDFEGSDMCEECGEAGVSIHLVRIEDGAVTHMSLCRRCAENQAVQAEGMTLLLALPASFPRAGEGGEQDVTVTGCDPLVCGVCGTTLADLKESGLVGCTVCYQVFGEHLRALMSEEDPVLHLGKVPQNGSEGDVLRSEMMRLERMLRELVDCERFEEAASVRDRLSELGRTIAGGS